MGGNGFGDAPSQPGNAPHQGFPHGPQQPPVSLPMQPPPPPPENPQYGRGPPQPQIPMQPPLHDSPQRLFDGTRARSVRIRSEGEKAFAMRPNTGLASVNLDTVTQQAGYLDTASGDQLFYWFFASRSDPSNDPVVIWLNGGPGCSSMEAIVFENGPVFMQNGQNKYNPYSWNTRANVLYIDNPAGVGFSVGNHRIDNSITAAEDFSHAITSFYRKYPFLMKNDLHIAGESYAGRYIPVFADAINADKRIPKKVKSVLIGNGLVSPIAEYSSYQPMLCGKGGRISVLSDKVCSKMENSSPNCLRHVQGCMNQDRMDCMLAGPACSPLEEQIQKFNPYDIRDASCADSKTKLCYPELDNVQDFFNSFEVKTAIGLSDPQNFDFQICNNKMNSKFYSSEDPFQPTFHNITNLLEGDTSVLVYNGDADIILNWLGGLQWTRDLEWSGHRLFNQAAEHLQKWRPKSDEKARGEFANYGNFTFMRVYDAGHMVPHDQPESAFLMLDTWIHGDPAFTAKYDTPTPSTAAGTAASGTPVSPSGSDVPSASASGSDAGSAGLVI